MVPPNFHPHLVSLTLYLSWGQRRAWVPACLSWEALLPAASASSSEHHRLPSPSSLQSASCLVSGCLQVRGPVIWSLWSWERRVWGQVVGLRTKDWAKKGEKEEHVHSQLRPPPSALWIHNEWLHNQLHLISSCGQWARWGFSWAKKKKKK